MISLKKYFAKNAPRILFGAFFLFASSCQDEPKVTSTPDPEPPPSQKKTTSPAETPAIPKEPAPEVAPEAGPESTAIRFVSYNIKNYLSMEVYRKGGIKEKRPKDPSEIEALVEIIVSEKPDILGICEIGTADDLADLQSRLKKAGLDLPHTIHAGGFDSVRHLAILSALPIESNDSEHHLPFEIDGSERMMGRGILDVTINLPNGPTHFVGLHLKSKRPTKDFDEAEIRLSEARLAKAHCDAILAADPDARIVLYGDMNDTRKTPPMSALMGRSNAKNFLGDVFTKDSRGHLWTHYWSYQQQYARFDFVLVSRSIKPEVDMNHSYVGDPDNWNEASDHRPVIVTFGK
jgi:endonuclease/exonuclease/phosphatase family metal-dependent hydrolase